MKIIDLLHRRPTLSFEIFPPKNHDGDISSIYQTIDELAKLKPDFISVTYGAGGSTTENTVEIASKIKNEYSIEAVAHLSCIDATPEQLIRVLDSLKANNIENVLALRGDYPRGYDPMKSLLNIAKLSGCNIPYNLSASIERFKSNPQAMKEVGMNYATNQIIDLITNGVDGIHLYTMNKPETVHEILKRTSNILAEFKND